MTNVLVANSNKAVGESWRNKLRAGGYNVLEECLSFSSMVFLLAREKVHIIVCDSSVVRVQTIPVLKEALEFFPRVRTVIIGAFDLYLKHGLVNVVFRNVFKPELEGLFERPTDIEPDDETRIKQCVTALLEDNFLSNEESATMLVKTCPKWQSGYVVITVKADSSFENVFEVISRYTGEQNIQYVARFRMDEVCLVLDGAPTEEQCLEKARQIREDLLIKTNAMFSIGVSRTRNAPHELYACRREAARAAAATHMFGYNAVIHINYLDSNDIPYVYPTHKEQRMIERTLDGDRAEAFRMLDEIFDVIKSKKDLRQMLVNKLALSSIVNLNIAAVSRAYALEGIQTDSLSLKELTNAKSVDEVYKFLKHNIEAFANEMDNMTNLRRETLYMELCTLGRDELSVPQMLKAFKTTVNFLNASVWKNDNSDIFSFVNKRRETN